MSERTLRWVGLALFGGIVALVVDTVVLAPGIDGSPGLTHDGFHLEAGYFATGSAMAVTSLLLLWARPGNSVGWLLGLSGFLAALCEWGQVYGAHALVVQGSELPFGRLVLSWSAPLWLPALMIPATLLLARYPSGHLQGQRARRIDRAVVLSLVLLWVGYAGAAGSVTDEVEGLLPPVLLPKVVSGTLLGVSAALILGGALAVAVMTLRRLLSSSWPERPQLALLLTATSLSVVLVILSPWEWLSSIAFALLPGAVAVGVLRYRLLGIEVVVRRTLFYGALTGMVLLVFVAVTSALTWLLPSGPAPQVVAASAVAVVLVPLRDRLQRLVDRLVYGDRDDPWRALGRLGKEAADGNALTDLVAAVAQSLRLPGAEVSGPDGTAASWGEVGADARVVPLVLAEEQVGELRVAHPRGERTLGAADDRLLDALAPLVALVLRGAVLTSALRVERERVVQATESERARLRRDLHDGLGPSLTGIGLGLEAVDSTALPDRSRAIVTRLRAEVGASLEEVRRIIDDLRPGALETSDLLGLVRARAQHLTATTPLRVDLVAPAALPPLPAGVEAAALRIVEEALTNVVRHARATRCTVTVSLDDGLQIEVRDDGIGFAGPRQGGVGLSSMRLRAAALGGSVELRAPGEGTPGEGTLVVAALPLGVPS